ncbi:MAG: polymorphic toxin-type HINT domain-containing protein, partial [Chloroflexota bacterium]
EATHKQVHDTTLEIVIDGETLHTTAEHPFFVPERGWVEAGQLNIGDLVRAADGSCGAVDSVTMIDEPQTMYNLTISLVATYLVGEQGWVVHNTNDFICRYLPAGEAGQYRLQTKDGPPPRVSGIYEYIDRTRDDLWYVGEATDLRARLRRERSEGRFNDWIEVIWTPLNVPQLKRPNNKNGLFYLRAYGVETWQNPNPIHHRMLKAAEKIRIIQLEEQFRIGREGIANAGESGDMNISTGLKPWLAAGGSLMRPGWPDWLFLYEDHLQGLK